MRHLLIEKDPKPVEHINQGSDSPILLVCEHAGQYVPEKLQNLGLRQETLGLHIGWDIGARAVTRRLSEKLGAHAILQRYSRLVIDCNRPPHSTDAMPEVSDGIPIKGNKQLTSEEKKQRIEEIFKPFDEALEYGRKEGKKRLLLSIHSFTPTMSGCNRPWDIGFLYRKDRRTASRLAALIKARNAKLCIGFNHPYTVDSDSDWFIPAHCEPSGLPHSLIEIRNDHVSDVEGQEAWADLLATAIRSISKEI